MKKPVKKAKPKITAKAKPKIAAKSKPVMKAKAPAKPAAKIVKKPIAKLAAKAKPAATKEVVKLEPKATAKVQAKAAAKQPTVKPVIEAKAPKVVEEKPAKVKVEKAPKEPKEFVIPEPEEIILTDAEGRRYCRVNECDQYSLVEGYCRYHYLFFWKRIQTRKKILSEGKLVRYIEELTGRYPDKYLEILLKDLRSQKDFLTVIQELELDDSSEEGEFEDDSQTFIDEVRGGGTDEPATTATEEDY